MADVYVKMPDPSNSIAKASIRDDRSASASADVAEASQCAELCIGVCQKIKNPAEEALAAAIRTPARVKRKRGPTTDVLLALENRHRWLLFAQHCYTCSRTEDACELGKLCTYGKKTLKHVAHCRRDDCSYPRCGLLKPLLQHSRKCQSSTCAICVPVWNYIQKDLQQQQQLDSQLVAPPPSQSQTQPHTLEHQHQVRPGELSTAADDMPLVACGVRPAAASRARGGPSTSSALGQQMARLGTSDLLEFASAASETALHSNRSCRAKLLARDDAAAAATAGSLSSTSASSPVGRGTCCAGGNLVNTDTVSAVRKPNKVLMSSQPPRRIQHDQSQQTLSSSAGRIPGPSALAAPPEMVVVAASSAAAATSYTTLPQHHVYGVGAAAKGMVVAHHVGSPTVELSSRISSGITILAPPSQPIHVAACTTMRPPPAMVTAGAVAAATPHPPHLVHSYPPATSVGNIYSHLPSQQPDSQHQHQPLPGPPLVPHWLSLTGRTGPSAMTSLAATVVAPNGAHSIGTAAAPQALWHGSGHVTSGPVALYSISTDTVRPVELGAMAAAAPPPGAVQTMDRYGHSFAIAGLNSCGVLPAAASAISMSSALLRIWPGSHPGGTSSPALAMPSASATVAGAPTPQGQVTAAMAAPPTPYSLAGRLSGMSGTMLSGAPHTLLHGHAGLGRGVTAGSAAVDPTGTGDTQSNSGGPVGTGVSGGTADAATTMLPEVSTRATPWSYLLR